MQMGDLGGGGGGRSADDGAAHRQDLAIEVSWGTLAIVPEVLEGFNGFSSGSPASEQKITLTLESLLVE